MTKFRALDRPTGEGSKSTKFEYCFNEHGNLSVATALPTNYDEVIFLGEDFTTKKGMFLTIDEDGDRFFYLGTKGSEFD